MRLSHRRHASPLAMNMTPMIDIVFQLLIFFMTVTQASRISKERLELPELKGGREQLATAVTLNVNEAGDVIISGDRYSVAEAITMVADEVERQGGPAGVAVVIRADRRGTSRTVNQLITGLNALGVQRVRIAVHASEY